MRVWKPGVSDLAGIVLYTIACNLIPPTIPPDEAIRANAFIADMLALMPDTNASHGKQSNHPLVSVNTQISNTLEWITADDAWRNGKR